MSFFDRDGNPVDVEFEKDQQTLIRKYIPKDATVLEMGARYGTVSCVLSEILQNPTHHVAVEPDNSVIEALKKNRENNGGKFHIFEGVVSRYGYNIQTKIVPENKYYDYATYTKKTDNPTVNNISLDQLKQEYNLNFDCVVADCEGFFCDFVEENPEDIKNMKVLIYEQDGTPWSEMMPKYQKLDKILEEYGFELVHTIPHPIYENNPKEHNVWIKRG